jgi:hypothetical protein
MSQQLKSHSRQARGTTTEALPQQAPLSFAHSTHTQHPWMVVSRALRANYDHQPGPMRFLISASAPTTRSGCAFWSIGAGRFMASVALSPPAYSFLRDRRKSDRSLSLLLIPAGYKPFSCCKHSTIVGPASAALAKRWLSPLRPVILVTVAEVDFCCGCRGFCRS